MSCMALIYPLIWITHFIRISGYRILNLGIQLYEIIWTKIESIFVADWVQIIDWNMRHYLTF